MGNLLSGVSCRVYFNFSHLNSTLHSKQSSLQASHTELDLRNIKVQMRSFKIFGIWVQTDRQTYIHTHVRNAVTLVWGSLRLAPISAVSVICLYNRRLIDGESVCRFYTYV